MSEELFTVSFDWNNNYAGRDENGRIKMARAGCGVLMDKVTAENLCRVLRPRYPNVKPVEIFRDDRDELAAHSLADLGEDTGLSDLSDAIERLAAQGFSREDIFAKCGEVLDALVI